MKNWDSGRRHSGFGRLIRPEAFAGRRAMGRTGKVADGSGNTRPGRRQMDIFLDALAESSNVAASARAADIAANAMYRERRRNPGFAARWHEALCEGFARLEIGRAHV